MSPVIGVILMVAIAVILAAVIGAFVLEIGDQQETAPKTSFTTEEGVYYTNGAGVDPGYFPAYEFNLTAVSITHAGGDTIEIDSLQASVNGNTTTWGPTAIPPEQAYISNIGALGSNQKRVEVIPQPNYFETLGSNEPTKYTSGDALHIQFRGGPYGENIQSVGAMSGDFRRLPSRENWNDQRGPWTWNGHVETGGADLVMEAATFSNPGYVASDVLRQGDSVDVIWTAESGGKSQTLQSYSVQQPVRDDFASCPCK